MIPNTTVHHFTENSTPMATEMVQVVAGGVALAVVVAVLLNAIKAATRGKHKAAPRLTLKGHAANWLQTDRVGGFLPLGVEEGEL